VQARANDVRDACARAGGALDEATWQIYAPEIPYRNTCAP
jgi:hypothetical protein